MKRSKKKLLSCGNCGGGLVIEHDEAGITLLCPKCVVNVAGPFIEAGAIPEYKPAARFKRRT